MNFQLDSSGLISALPFLIFGIGIISIGAIADFIKTREYVTVTKMLKYFTCIGMTIQGILMLVTAYSTDPTVCVILITCAVGIGASVYPGS